MDFEAKSWQKHDMRRKSQPYSQACVAVKLSRRCRFTPLKNSLRSRSGLASHWSASHTQFWSAVRYGSFATDHKRQVDKKPLTWSPTGERLDLYEEAQEGFMATVLRKRRETAEMMPDDSHEKRAFSAIVRDAPLLPSWLVTCSRRGQQDSGRFSMPMAGIGNRSARWTLQL